jgi:hypothetical protein
MKNYSTSTPRNNPRLIITVNTDESATVKGCYICARDNVQSIARTYSSEEQAREEFAAMRDRGCEFSYTVNRKAA